MKYTGNYSLRKPDYTDTVDIADINANFDTIDSALTPTADPSQTPTGVGPGKLVQWVSWLTNRIKAITGKTNWYDAPDITLATLATHKTRHATGGTDALTPADIGAANTTTASMTIYVDAVNGNDSNPGTQTYPLKTIQAAVNKIPSVVKHTVTINIVTGTYNENITINGITGSGTVKIIGGSDLTSAANYVINGRLILSSCSNIILIQGLTIKMNSGSFMTGIIVSSCLSVRIVYCNINGQSFSDSNRAGIYCEYGNLTINNCSISNLTSTGNYSGAIMSAGCGIIDSYSNTGSNNTYGLNARAGIIFREDTTQPTATTATVTSGGGQIY